MAIDWERLSREDFNKELYKNISNIRDSIERAEQEQKMFGRAKKLGIKQGVESVYKEVKKEAELNFKNNMNIDFGDNAPVKTMSAPGYYKDQLGHIHTLDKGTLVTSTLIEPIAIFKNVDTREELVKCAFFNGKIWDNFVINREVLINNGKITRLANKGIDVTSDSSRLLVGFIRNLLNNNDIPEYKSTSKMGWH